MYNKTKAPVYRSIRGKTNNALRGIMAGMGAAGVGEGLAIDDSFEGLEPLHDDLSAQQALPNIRAKSPALDAIFQGGRNTRMADSMMAQAALERSMLPFRTDESIRQAVETQRQTSPIAIQEYKAKLESELEHAIARAQQVDPVLHENLINLQREFNALDLAQEQQLQELALSKAEGMGDIQTTGRRLTDEQVAPLVQAKLGSATERAKLFDVPAGPTGITGQSAPLASGMFTRDPGADPFLDISTGQFNPGRPPGITPLGTPDFDVMQLTEEEALRMAREQQQKEGGQKTEEAPKEPVGRSVGLKVKEGPWISPKVRETLLEMFMNLSR